ncbi:MAG: hypothetical protein ACOX6G_03245 [Christensenellales bacterium]|jgi:hypothetical protein|nr:hypothetical protein [Clostridiales bacterium]
MNKVIVKNENGETSIEINGMTIKGVLAFNFAQDEDFSDVPVFSIKFIATDTIVEN